MELNKWIGSYKIRAFLWIDGKRIYFNVQYFAPGQSIEKPPVWDKTVFIMNDTAGQKLVYDFTHSLVEHVAKMQISSEVEITLTAERSEHHE